MNENKIAAAILAAAYWNTRQKAPDSTDNQQVLESYQWFLKQLAASEKNPFLKVLKSSSTEQVTIKDLLLRKVDGGKF
jgi:hypothetical protein